MPEYKREELKLVVKIIRRQFPSAHMIILFGSYARDEWVENIYTEGHYRLYKPRHRIFKPLPAPVGRQSAIQTLVRKSEINSKFPDFFKKVGNISRHCRTI